MKYSFCLCLGLCFLIFQSKAQNSIEGIVIDGSSTTDKVSFASLINLSNNRVYISNENGFFFVNSSCIDKDFLVSCVGYISKVVKLKKTNNVIKLSKNIMILNAIEVAAKSPNYLALFSKVLKNYKGKKTDIKKCFLNLKTSGGDHNLLELVQGYYNLSMDASHIISTDLKTGKIAIGNNTNFLTVDFTKLLGYFSITKSRDAKITWPGNLSLKNIKKNYNIKAKGIYLQEKDTIIQFEFIPKKINSPRNFIAMVHINKRTQLFEKLLIYNSFNNTALKLIKPIFPEDSIGKVDLKINIDFKNENHKSQFSKITLNYSLAYTRKSLFATYSSTLNAFVLENSSYFIPLPQAEELNDYQKILAQPVSQHFWENNIVFPDINHEYNEFVKQNKSLDLNDPMLSKIQIINPSIIPWTKNLLHNPAEISFDTSISNPNYNYLIDIPQYSDLVNVDVKIWMDVSNIDHKKEVLLATLFNKNRSFYLLRDKTNKQMYLNTIFNIGEKYKRILGNSLKGVEDNELILKLYKENNKKMEEEIKHINQYTIYGSIKDNLEKVYNEIRTELLTEN